MKYLGFRLKILWFGFVIGSQCSWVGALRADDWPQWRGPNRDGISKETGWKIDWPNDGPKKLWEGNVGVGYSSCSVSQGRLFTMGNVADTDSVICFDAESGKLNWKH